MKKDLYACLKPLTPRKSRLREGFCTFDIETKDGLKGKQIFCWKLAHPKPRTKALGVIGGRNGLEEMFKFFESRIEGKTEPKDIVVYVHNLGFDVRFIEDYCIRHNIERQPILSGSKMIAYIIDNLKVRFVDSLQFLFSSQEKAEIIWGVDKELRKINCKSIFNKPYTEWSEQEKEKVENHNVNDVLALHQIMENFRETMFKITKADVVGEVSLASLSLKGYRNHMEHPIYNPFIYKTTKGYAVDNSKEKFARASYFGGRTECFDLNPFFADSDFIYPTNKEYSREFILNHLHKLAYVDRVSHYPAEMMFNFFPMGIPKWVHGNEDIKKEIEKGKLGIVEIEYIANENETYPVLPSKRDGRLCFTNESGHGIFCIPEVLYALERGYKVNFVKALIYPEKKKIFSKYMKKLGKLKMESKGGKRQGSKICMNSLYGKFGQAINRKEFKMKFYNEDQQDDMLEASEKGLIVKYSQEYGMYYSIEIVESTTKRPFQNVVIASYVCAYGRVSLVKQMHKMEKLGCSTVYCDTDSTVVFTDNLHLIELSKEIGGWDVENYFEYFHAYAPKSYVMIKEGEGYLVKLKGAARDGVREILKTSHSIPEIESRIQQPIAEAERYATFKQSLRYGFALKTRKLSKHFSFEYAKRKVLEDKTTRAWINSDN